MKRCILATFWQKQCVSIQNDVVLINAKSKKEEARRRVVWPLLIFFNLHLMTIKKDSSDNTFQTFILSHTFTIQEKKRYHPRDLPLHPNLSKKVVP